MKIKRIVKNIVYRLNIIIVFICLHTICRELLTKEIWLISEKRTEARDNGYHLFKYLVELNDKNLCPVYVIDKKSADYQKIKSLGKIIQYDSLEHFLYYIAATFRIGGQVQGGKPYIDTAKQATLKLLRNRKQIHFFIKHGIAKDDIPSAYDYRQAGYDVMFCGSEKEYEYYKNRYNYPDNRIRCPGLCRFDNLLSEDITEDMILVMPTYRKWLQPSDSSKEANEEEKQRFRESEYFRKWYELLVNKELTEELTKSGYRLIFYPHYTMQPFIETFQSEEIPPCITIASRKEYDVQNLLMRTKLLITDYSSVFFDVSYMGKCIDFYQFDEKKYREEHYSLGWFDYKKDAMGPIFTEEDKLVDDIVQRLENGFEMEGKYKSRIDNLYKNIDRFNCKRVYETIKLYRGIKFENNN